MKTIVISGARSNVGKTTLARNLAALLDDSVFVKIGHHQNKKANDDLFFQMGTSINELSRVFGSHRYLIIESNSILTEFKPDCTIFLSADSPKPSASFAEKKADIIRGGSINESKFTTLAAKLEIEPGLMRQIIALAGVSLEPLPSVD